MDGFKVPQSIPQDLLLIRDLVGISEEVKPTPLVTVKVGEQDDISSSDSESNASEDEIVASLIEVKDEEEPVKEVPDSSESSSESSSDSDSESEPPEQKNALESQDLDDDEDPVPSAATGNYFSTKHEIPEVDIIVPELDEVEANEVLEKVGEIMNTMEKVAIIRGLPSEIANRGSDRALDSDTLLVFDDRKVMGYVYETFGPTSQPLYQVKFNNTYPLNPEQVRIGREVFHVPARSHFVFLSRIKALKGSDASNVHDEEPGDDELEFSDDEAEAAYRSRLKRKRGESRARSIASSRQGTPNPSQMRDQDLVDDSIMTGNAYDERGPYDYDIGAAPGPSRPAPIPYDDPYANDYSNPEAAKRVDADRTQLSRLPSNSGFGGGRGSARGYDRGEGRNRGRGRGRGRGQDRGRGSHGASGGGRGSHHGNDIGGTSWSNNPTALVETYDPTLSRPLSPTSLAIARATGQMPQSANPTSPQQQQQFPVDTNAWRYNDMPVQTSTQYGFGSQSYQQPFMQQMPFVQPHINPRFASAFGMGFGGSMQTQQYPQHGHYSHSDAGSMDSVPPTIQSNWTDEWTIHMPDRAKPGSGDDSKNSSQ
ncbi:Gar1/Naf1 RNA binding region-domain-containing protein [Crucibulum laeve]|uniref:H/ACA ribonucleoprotein complex non-core subunit NAF1 n=1 Tax=Crucibulum laeve TaxID=68775 RepID=A0A5C3MBM6_9AGAR|nr:Gar1/Naf1 RNA binding region-domain-containing protein [Crucibulum laeve]